MGSLPQNYQMKNIVIIGGGTGTAIGFALSATMVEPLQWLRTDLRFEQGIGL